LSLTFHSELMLLLTGNIETFAMRQTKVLNARESCFQFPVNASLQSVDDAAGSDCHQSMRSTAADRSGQKSLRQRHE
jgi:hypothetical protein